MTAPARLPPRNEAYGFFGAMTNCPPRDRHQVSDPPLAEAG
ncbi:hypothetical protein SAMN05444421_107184 [Celeribacter marinus]|nr:hypothetical protein SAMN05444421_107184 [Celeribacter marinus]